jgi:hypothetical protein
MMYNVTHRGKICSIQDTEDSLSQLILSWFDYLFSRFHISSRQIVTLNIKENKVCEYIEGGTRGHSSKCFACIITCELQFINPNLKLNIKDA